MLGIWKQNGGVLLAGSKQQSPYTVASVARAMDLLIILGQYTQDMGVTELSKILGVQKSTVHSLLQTLLGRGFVQQTETGRYTLGVKLIELGNICAERLDIWSAARPIMSELADETGEIVLLAMLSQSELVIVEKVVPQKPFLIIPKLDFSIALHSTSVGKVLLAYADEEIIAKVLGNGLQKYTPNTITDALELRAELEKVKVQGYALCCNETIDGVTCIAAPVFAARDNVVAALSLSSAASVLTSDRYDYAITVLKQKALEISKKLGYV